MGAVAALGARGSVVAAARVRRWSVVAAVVVVLVAVPAVVAAWPADPAVTVAPAALRDRVVASAGVPWSGYAESSGALNLPRLGQLADLTTLLSGTTRLRAWYAGPERARVDQLDVSGERDRYTFAGGQAVWDYGSSLLTFVDADPLVRLPRPDDLLPPQLARRLIAGTAPGDAVSGLPARRVAGVDAAGFRVSVSDPRTTVGALDVWADPVSGLPVDVEVVPRGTGGPAVATRFLDLAQESPDEAALVPPRVPGAGVTRSPTSDLFGVLGRGSPRAVPPVLDGRSRERPQRGFGAIGHYGTDLAQLVAVPLSPDLAGTLLSGLDRAGSAGRRISVGTDSTVAGALQSPLLSLAVVRVQTGPGQDMRAWAVAGLVPPDVLDRAVAELAAGARE